MVNKAITRPFAGGNDTGPRGWLAAGCAHGLGLKGVERGVAPLDLSPKPCTPPQNWRLYTGFTCGFQGSETLGEL
jgi:hypothetical protein